MSAQAFMDIQNSKHWDEQVSYLQQIQSSQTTARLLGCPKNAMVIKQLLSNSRTKVITSTIIFLIQLFDKYGPLLHNFALSIMGTDILFKLLNSSNKVVFSSAHQLLKAIVINCPHSKFYSILITQFNSKNSVVRQCISAYFLVLADTIQFPHNFINIVRNWKNDANKKVRQNMLLLEQIILRQDKKSYKKIKNSKSQIKTKQNDKQNTPYFPKPKNKQKMREGTVQNSQIIIESFTKSNEQSYIDHAQNIRFLISKIQSDEGWNMKLFAIEELCSICQASLFQKNVFDLIVPTFVKLLDQRRSKIYAKVSQTLIDVIDLNQHQFATYLDTNFTYFTEKAIKNQQNGVRLICRSVEIEPQKYIFQLSQISTEIKSIKQKITLLDTLVELICKCSTLPFQKASIITKTLCSQIQKYHTNKQIYLPCMAILSHFKQKFPQQFLSCLLCQQKQILNKIISIAQEIDPQLRDGIVNYIHSLKGIQKKEKKEQKLVHMENSQLADLLMQIIGQDEQVAVSRLAEYVFEMKQQIATDQYFQIIKLTEKVTCENSLLELQLLLQQICKSPNEKFLDALFRAIASCNPSSIQAEYIVTYLRKIYTIFSNCPWLMCPKHSLKLITTYRYSKCPRVRLHCIKTLALFPNQIIASNINSKQKDLIKSQHKNQSISDFLR